MENFGIILLTAGAVVMLAVIIIYNHYDRLRFRLERSFAFSKKPIAQWVRVCAALRGGDDCGYSRCRSLADKTACIRTLVAETKENSEEKLDLQEALLPFCGTFNLMAEKYDRQLEIGPIGKIAKHLGFHPVGRIDFYPDVRI